MFLLPARRLQPASVPDAVRRGRPLERNANEVALAWLLQRSPNILLIPGTSSVAHLRENLAAAALELPREAVAALDAIG
jgi:pyridoxine 4-dehydrogenase